MKTESKMTDELVETLSTVKWTNIIDSLTPTSTFTIDPRLGAFSDIFMEAGCEEFIDILRNSIYASYEDKNTVILMYQAHLLILRLNYNKIKSKCIRFRQNMKTL